MQRDLAPKIAPLLLELLLRLPDLFEHGLVLDADPDRAPQVQPRTKEQARGDEGHAEDQKR